MLELHVVAKVLLCGYPECFANISIKLWKVLRSLFVWLVMQILSEHSILSFYIECSLNVLRQVVTFKF